MLARPRVLSRRGRGATLLVFLVVGLPVLLFNSVLVVDLSRVITTGRYVANVADAAALAGAQQFTGTPAGCDEVSPPTCTSYSTTLSPPRAVVMMGYMVDVATPPGPLEEAGLELVVGPGSPTLEPWPGGDPVFSGVYSVPDRPGAPAIQRATAVVEYRVPGLVFLPALEGLVGDEDLGAEFVQVARSADVCVPGQYSDTDGHCTRPDLRTLGSGN